MFTQRKPEAEDLSRLMRVYNFWTHKLHPKLKFHDTVVRIEKMCHAKRMQVGIHLREVLLYLNLFLLGSLVRLERGGTQ